jgi:hypothetical protein
MRCDAHRDAMAQQRPQAIDAVPQKQEKRGHGKRPRTTGTLKDRHMTSVNCT